MPTGYLYHVYTVDNHPHTFSWRIGGATYISQSNCTDQQFNQGACDFTNILKTICSDNVVFLARRLLSDTHFIKRECNFTITGEFSTASYSESATIGFHWLRSWTEANPRNIDYCSKLFVGHNTFNLCGINKLTLASDIPDALKAFLTNQYFGDVVDVTGNSMSYRTHLTPQYNAHAQRRYGA